MRKPVEVLMSDTNQDVQQMNVVRGLNSGLEDQEK